jgi:hypothetical protein
MICCNCFGGRFTVAGIHVNEAVQAVASLCQPWSKAHRQSVEPGFWQRQCIRLSQLLAASSVIDRAIIGDNLPPSI